MQDTRHQIDENQQMMNSIGPPHQIHIPTPKHLRVLEMLTKRPNSTGPLERAWAKTILVSCRSYLNLSAEGWPYLHEHHNLSRSTLGVSFKKLAQRPFSEHQKKSPNKIKTPRRCRIDQLWHLFRRWETHRNPTKTCFFGDGWNITHKKCWVFGLVYCWQHMKNYR